MSIVVIIFKAINDNIAYYLFFKYETNYKNLKLNN